MCVFFFYFEADITYLGPLNLCIGNSYSVNIHNFPLVISQSKT